MRVRTPQRKTINDHAGTAVNIFFGVFIFIVFIMGTTPLSPTRPTIYSNDHVVFNEETSVQTKPVTVTPQTEDHTFHYVRTLFNEIRNTAYLTAAVFSSQN